MQTWTKFSIWWSHYNANLSKIFYLILKLTEYWDSAVNVVSSNPCVGSLPRIKISSSYYQYAWINSYQLQKWYFYPCYHRVMKILSVNQILYCSHYLSGSAFSVNFTAPNEQSFRTKSVFLRLVTICLIHRQ